MSMDQIQEYRCPLSPVGEAPLSPAYTASEWRTHSHTGTYKLTNTHMQTHTQTIEVVGWSITSVGGMGLEGVVTEQGETLQSP